MWKFISWTLLSHIFLLYDTVFKTECKEQHTTITVAINQQSVWLHICLHQLMIWGATFSNLALSPNHSNYVPKGQKIVVYQACMIHSVCQAMDQACGLNTQWALPLSFIRLQSAELPSVCLQNDAPLQLLLIIYICSHYIWQQDNLRGC